MSDLPVIVEEEQVLQYITFRIGDEYFGVDIQYVLEIILRPQSITSIPCTPDYFVGITNLRGETISVIDLRTRFGLPYYETTEESRVIVVDSQDMKLGMVVDRVVSITHMEISKIKKSPPFVSNEKQKYISGSYQLENSSLLLLLEHEQIIVKSDFLSVLDIKHIGYDDLGENALVEEKPKIREVHMVGFSIGQEYHALEGNAVEEIIEFPELTEVPQMEDFVEGIFYLRSNVIPLIQLSKRLEIQSSLQDRDGIVIITKIAGLRVGLVVDRISGVFNIPEDEILSPPSNLSKEQVEQLTGIIKRELDGRMRVVMVLNCDTFFNQAEKEQLKQLDEQVGNEEEEKHVTEEEDVPIIEFLIHGKRFAILVAEANEILPIGEIVSVPKTPPFVRGVTNLRGIVTTVLDLPKLIYDEDYQPTESTKLLIVQPREEAAGLIVDEIIGIRRVYLSSFEPPSELVTEKDNLFIQGIGKYEKTGAIVILIDIEKTILEVSKYQKSKTEEIELIEEGSTPELLMASTEE